MSEIIQSFNLAIKNRLTNKLYGTFIFIWIVCHWSFLYSLFCLDEIQIFEVTHMLKNEYLISRYFDLNHYSFWISWILPFLLTYLTIWYLPETILLKAFEKIEKYESDKKIIKIKLQKNEEQENAKLETETAKKITAVAKQITESKKIKDADPAQVWSEEYQNFKKIDFAYKFSKIIESFYKRKALIIEYSEYGENIIFEIPEDILAYSHSNGIIEIDQITNKIIVTEKGKYFINKFLSDPSRPVDIPF